MVRIFRLDQNEISDKKGNPMTQPFRRHRFLIPDAVKDRGSRSSEYTSKEKIEREAGQAGFELVRVEDFLARDNLFVLRVKAR
jgi:hypothetical protein